MTALRAFLGLCNYYAAYVRMFAELAAPLQEKLKLPRELGKAGSKHKLEWTQEDLIAFERLKKALVADLELHHVDTTKPFVLKTDASQYAIGAVLEQFPGIDGEPALEDIKPGTSVPIGFLSRKLTVGQRDKWDTRDKETYAVVSGLERWAGHIGYNKVLVLTDHKSLESWHKEHVAGMGPTGRRARWHSKLNKFRIDVIHIPGSTNVVSDALSRWAYPACSGSDDISWHGTASDMKSMDEAIAQEKKTEQETPKARHPLDDPTPGVPPGEQSVTVATVTLSDGTPSTVIHLPGGRTLGLAWVTFEKSKDMDIAIAAVTRNQAKKETEQARRAQRQQQAAAPAPPTQPSTPQTKAPAPHPQPPAQPREAQAQTTDEEQAGDGRTTRARARAAAQQEERSAAPEEQEDEGRATRAKARAAAQQQARSAEPEPEPQRQQAEGHPGAQRRAAAAAQPPPGVPAQPGADEGQDPNARGELLAEDWAAEYRRCPTWSRLWQQV